MQLADTDPNATELLELIPTPEPHNPARCVHIEIETRGATARLNQRIRAQIRKVCERAGVEVLIAHRERTGVNAC